MLAGVALVAMVVAVLLARAALFSPSTVDDWARSRGLRLNEENRPLVVWYLRTARVLRTSGVACGLLLPPLVGLAFGTTTGGAWGAASPFVGYMIGAIYAEIALVRPRGGRATVSRRRLGAYLPHRMLVAQRLLGVVGVAAVGLALQVDADPAWTGFGRRLVVGAGLVAVVLPLVLEGVQRWLVRRPQPVLSAPLLAADDAIRSQSVHSVSGSGMGLQLVVLSVPFGWLDQSDVQAFRWIFTILTLAVPVLAFYACLYYGHRSWQVRRADRLDVRRAPC